MNPKPDDDDGADLLMAKSKSALTRIPIAHLKAFCKDHDLTVSPTGKTGAIKKDYVATVWFHNKGSSGMGTNQSNVPTTTSLIRSGEDLDRPFSKRQKTSHLAQEPIEPEKDAVPSFVRIIDETNATITAARKRSAEMLRRDAPTEPMMAAPRKRLGDSNDAPPPKRQKKTEPVSDYTKVVVVHLYKNRLDWDYIREARVTCDNNGGLDLEQVREQLGVQGRCRLIDPQNKWPFHLYNGNIVDSEDVVDLTEDGCLQVVCNEGP